MSQVEFFSQVRKAGTSYVITIPSDIVKNYLINEGDGLKVSADIVPESFYEEEQLREKLSKRYHYSGKGVLKYKDKIVAELDSVFYNELKFQGVITGDRLDWSNAPIHSVFVGVIHKGRSNVSTAIESYGEKILATGWFSNHLMYSEVMELVLSDGRTIRFTKVTFPDGLKLNSPEIKDVEFKGYLVDG